MYFRILDCAMEQLGESLAQPGDPAEALQRIVTSARDTIPGADQASITVRNRDDTLQTVAATAAVVRRADELQYELREGPCYDAVTAAPISYTPELARADEWPRFAPRMVELGFHAQMAIRLTEACEKVTGLNLYSQCRDAFDPTDGLPQLFASHARIALGYATELQNLQVALNSRATIGTAIGIVMERYNLTQERSFEFLIRLSQESNTKLRDIAATIVQTRVIRARTSQRSAQSHAVSD